MDEIAVKVDLRIKTIIMLAWMEYNTKPKPAKSKKTKK